MGGSQAMTKKKKEGRRPLLLDDPSIQDRICKAVAQGCSYEQAAAFGGIHVGTLYAWLSNGREEEDTNHHYRRFFDAVQKARAHCMLKHLANIDRAAENGDWKASAWKLERIFGMIAKDRPEVEVNIAIENVDTEELIQQLRKTEDLIKLQGPIIDIEEE